MTSNNSSTWLYFHIYARNVQITTWDPTPKGSAKPGRETVDYASKHWAGLIKDYYARRVSIASAQAKPRHHNCTVSPYKLSICTVHLAPLLLRQARIPFGRGGRFLLAPVPVRYDILLTPGLPL